MMMCGMIPLLASPPVVVLSLQMMGLGRLPHHPPSKFARGPSKLRLIHETLALLVGLSSP